MWAWALLPVTLAVFGTVGLWVVYGIAVHNNTVNITVEFPYISMTFVLPQNTKEDISKNVGNRTLAVPILVYCMDTKPSHGSTVVSRLSSFVLCRRLVMTRGVCGSYNPQSCLFAQICNICCVLAMWIVSIRFQQIQDYGCASRTNTAGLVLGFISSIGISILGNFQQSVQLEVHLLGAFLAFFLGLVYFWIQTWLTYSAQPSHDRRWVGRVRIILCGMCTCLVISMVVLHNVKYRSEAAVCEWFLVMCFFALFGVFAVEFRHIDFHKFTVQKEGMKTANDANGVWTLQEIH